MIIVSFHIKESDFVNAIFEVFTKVSAYFFYLN